MLPYIVTMRGGHITCEDFEWGDSLDTVMKSKGWTKKNINDEETNTQLDGDIPFKYPGGLAQVSYRFVDNKLFGSDYFLLQKDKEEQDSVLKELTEQAEQYWPKPIGQTLDENLKRVGARWFDEDKGYVDMLIGVTGDTNEHFIKLTIRAPTEYKKALKCHNFALINARCIYYVANKTHEVTAIFY